jgi:hypothetical protein
MFSCHSFRSFVAAITVAFATTLAASAQIRAIDHRVLKEPPFYHTFARKAVPVAGPVLVLPVRPYDGTGGSPLFDDHAGLATIARAIDARLATLTTVRRVEGPPLRPGHWPAVMLGDEEIATGESRQAGNRRAALAVTRPSRDWSRAFQSVLDEAAANHYIVINLGLAELYLRQDWLGRKSLPIGTDYVVPVPWMNDLESTVGVLALSGAVYDRNGRVVRAGSEGILAGQPTFWQGVLAKTITGGRGRISTIGDADDPRVVLETHRRLDLPGHPLAWEVALDNLLRQLLGQQYLAGSE